MDDKVVRTRFGVKRRELADALKYVKNAVKVDNTTLPSMKAILMRTSGNELEILGTDLELTITARIPATVAIPGALLVNHKVLTETVAAMPEGDVDIRVDDKDVGYVTVRKSNFNLFGIDPADFPEIPENPQAQKFELPEDMVWRFVNQTIFACATDDGKPVLTAVMLDIKSEGAGSEVKMVATDTHKLAVTNYALDQVGLVLNRNIPSRTLKELGNILEQSGKRTVLFEVDVNMMRITVGEFEILTRLLEGAFPKYERVVPKEYRTKVAFNREDLLGVLRRARIVAREATAKDRVILRFFEEGIVVVCEGESGRFREEVDAAHEGPSIRVAFNVVYLLDALSAMNTETAVVEMTEKLSPVTFRPVDQKGSDMLCVVMPMQVDGDVDIDDGVFMLS